MSIAAGKYICVIDSDSIARLNRLELQYSYLETYSFVGCIGRAFEIIDKNKKVLRTAKMPLNYPMLKILLLKNNYVSHPTVMIRSHLVKKYRLFYNETYRCVSDYDFIVRASKVFTARNLKEVLIQCRSHQTQISSAERTKKKILTNEIRKRQLKPFGIT